MFISDRIHAAAKQLDKPLINLSREVKPRRSRNLAGQDCLALLGGEWRDEGPNRENLCSRNGRKRAWCRCCLHTLTLRKPLDLRKHSLCGMESHLNLRKPECPNEPSNSD